MCYTRQVWKTYLTIMLSISGLGTSLHVPAPVLQRTCVTHGRVRILVPVPKSKIDRGNSGPQVRWKTGVVTTYSRCFEGKEMAWSGHIFSHRGRYIASRCGSFGRKIQLSYGKNGRSIAIIGDRGGLPLDDPKHGVRQFDVSFRVARELGLYSPRYGRKVKWRFL
jgi:hypothetical protein